MDFRIRQNLRFKTKVKVAIPDDTGGHQVEDFDAIFEAIPQAEFDAFWDGKSPMGDAGLLRRVLVGWARLKAEDGTDLPFSEEAREQLIAIPYARTATARAYVVGVAGAKEGN